MKTKVLFIRAVLDVGILSFWIVLAWPKICSGFLLNLNLLANPVISRNGHYTKRKSAVFSARPKEPQTSVMILGWKFFHLLKLHCIWAEFVPSIWLGTAVGDQEKWIFFPQATVIRGEISK